MYTFILLVYLLTPSGDIQTVLPSYHTSSESCQAEKHSTIETMKAHKGWSIYSIDCHPIEPTPVENN